MQHVTPLQIVPQQSAGPLTPEQKRFNKLSQQIEQARRKLQAWTENIPLYVQAHGQRIRPMASALLVQQREWVFAIDRLLALRRWTKVEHELLTGLLCEMAAAAVEGAEGEQDLEMKAIYDKHADLSFDDDQAEELKLLQAMMEGATGLDLGDADEIESADELYARLHEKMGEAHAQAQAAQPQKPVRRTAAQARRQAEKDAEAAQSLQSLRDIYRQLVSALHPDREPDAQLRDSKTALMKRVNTAYDAKDLLGLLSLQLACTQIDADAMARAAPERLKLYNKALADQLQALQEEARRVEHGFRMEFAVDPHCRLNPNTLVTLLDAECQQLAFAKVTLARDLKQLQDPVTAKAWLKMERQRMREEALDEDWFF